MHSGEYLALEDIVVPFRYLFKRYSTMNEVHAEGIPACGNCTFVIVKAFPTILAIDPNQEGCHMDLHKNYLLPRADYMHLLIGITEPQIHSPVITGSQHGHRPSQKSGA